MNDNTYTPDWVFIGEDGFGFWCTLEFLEKLYAHPTFKKALEAEANKKDNQNAGTAP